MFENITKFFKKIVKKQNNASSSKDTAKERLHLVLMQDRANVSADFLDLMRQEIIDVIKKYIEVDESAIDVRLTNKENEDGTNGAPALYANIPIINIKEEAKKEEGKIAKERKEAELAKKSETKSEEVKKESKKEEEEIESNKAKKNDDPTSEQTVKTEISDNTEKKENSNNNVEEKKENIEDNNKQE